MKKFYITNSIPYVNASPHIGHALEFVQSDTVRRYHEDLLQDETALLCGSDDNALKNVQAAEKKGKEVRQFVGENAVLFQELAKKLDVQFDFFQHGSDEQNHYKASQKLWELSAKNGDIYEKEYEGLYCVGCETFYTPDELDENGECFEHPGKKLDKVKETNYFFRLSKYKEPIKKLIESNELVIFPQERRNEVLSFINGDVHDISISRSNERAKNWGVPVPGDDKQRMYVWFDALNIYQSGIGFGWNDELYNKWWPADLQVIGKGIIRFHAVYWPAFLLSAGLKPSKSLFVHGYITVEGQKMSKTLGNVIDPMQLIEKYGSEAIRYYFLREIPPFGDGDFSESRFKELYNADLANGLGNLVARITKLAEGLQVDLKKPSLTSEYKKRFDEYRFNEVLMLVWESVRTLDRYINETKPWGIKDKEKYESVLTSAIQSLYQIGFELLPFLPKTAKNIQQVLTQKIAKPPTLFPRL